MTITPTTRIDTTTLARAGYRLADGLEASAGTVFLTGTQALIRLLTMQQRLDRARGWSTQGFLSGYRGSPLGGVDRAAWKAQDWLAQHDIRFLPAVNEELGATAVLGTQRVESDPLRTADGVFAMWYGKGPGVDRAGDALKHGNAYGSSPHGGVLVVAGDDHGCVSSSMPHQSDQVLQAWHMPIVSPANVAEYLSFGLYGWALSRYSGNWVAMTALSEVVESAMTVDLDHLLVQVDSWRDADEVDAITGHAAPSDGLHYRWPDLPSVRIEERLLHKLLAVQAFAQVNSIDQLRIPAPRARIGIVTVGKAHTDALEAMRLLAITDEQLAQAGVRFYKVGLSHPIARQRMREFAQGLQEILVIEEKGPVVESQMRDLFYNDAARPLILGKQDRDGASLLPPLAELRPSGLAPVVASWLARHHASLDRRHRVLECLPLHALSNAADGVKRVPYFCAGCPHNTSTKVPGGSRAQAGIGCHFMASWMDRDTTGLIQMGGEGVDWVAHSQFTRARHVFQNLGDGTYYHSGLLAIRQAIAANTNITYKILFNDAVAMTGGQPVDGTLTVDGLARQLEAEGARRIDVVSDDINALLQGRGFPAHTHFHDRAELDQVQRELREEPGVTVLIYQQTCAAEKRRLRKVTRSGHAPSKQAEAKAERHVFINTAVCEGCGDCAVQSNCVAIVPDDTAAGRKRQVDQHACNKDESCVNGFCPSFVTVSGGRLRKPAVALDANDEGFKAMVHALPMPDFDTEIDTAPYELLLTGVGGTGVVTMGAIIAMAAHLEGQAASVLDFTGFAQKGGAVLSFVRIARHPGLLHQSRIDAQQAHAVLGCDMVVAASPEALGTMRRGRTRLVVNAHETPVAQQLMNADTGQHASALLDKLRHAAGPDRIVLFNANEVARRYLGDAIGANIVLLGYAWQRGLVPVSLPAIERAIELNGVATSSNLRAFALGRLQAGNAKGCEKLLRTRAASDAPTATDLPTFVAHARVQLEAYQNAAYAQRFVTLVDAVHDHETQLSGHAEDTPLTMAVARNMLKLMTYKDEYEVARLYADRRFDDALKAQFQGEKLTLTYFMAPPLWLRQRDGRPRAKVQLGPWMRPVLKVLAKMRFLRGTPWDLFGRTGERRMERHLIDAYEQCMRGILPHLVHDKLPLTIQLANVPQGIRGFGHVKDASVAIARTREAELLHRLDPSRVPRPQSPAMAGQIKGIPIRAA